MAAAATREMSAMVSAAKYRLMWRMMSRSMTARLSQTRASKASNRSSKLWKRCSKPSKRIPISVRICSEQDALLSLMRSRFRVGDGCAYPEPTLFSMSSGWIAYVPSGVRWELLE